LNDKKRRSFHGEKYALTQLPIDESEESLNAKEIYSELKAAILTLGNDIETRTKKKLCSFPSQASICI
jgi:hypothetical protein